MNEYALVYQCGIANVFKYGALRHTASRVLQSDFRSCELFASGLLEAGCIVEVRHSNYAGDITTMPWVQGPGDLFSDAKRPPITAKYAA